MGYPALYLLLLCGLSYVGAQNWKPFDCRRTNSQCRLNVGVCLSDGSCNCTLAIPRVNGFQGFDCNLETATINSTCTLCQNGGTCYRDSTGGMGCYCPPRYTGETCEKNRVDVTVCNATHIGMYIKPHHATLFNGIISIIQEANFNTEILLTDPECFRRGIIDREADNSYFILAGLDSSSPCYNALQIMNDTGGVVRYEYKVRLNYNSFETPLDETHTFVCEINPNGNIPGVKIGTERRDLNGTLVQGLYRAAEMKILLRQGSQKLADATPFFLYVGQQLFVQAALKPGRYFTKLAVDRCVAFPFSDGSGTSVEFFKDRCPNDAFLSVVDSSVGSVRVSDSEVLIAIYAIRFLSSSDLYISCDITVCSSRNLEECAPANCSQHLGGANSGHGRKKRESDQDSAEHMSFRNHAIVLPSKEELDAVLGCETRVVYPEKETSWYQNTVFLAVAIVSGVLLIVTLVIAIVLCRRYASIHKPSH